MTPIRAADVQVAPLVPRDFRDGFTVEARLDLTAAGASIARAELTQREWRLFTRAVPMTTGSIMLGGFTTTIMLKGDRAVADGNDVPAAHGVRVRHDDGGCLVEYLDERGEPFAVADFDPDKFARFVGECCDLLEIVSKGGLATLQCRGQG